MDNRPSAPNGVPSPKEAVGADGGSAVDLKAIESQLKVDADEEGKHIDNRLRQHLAWTIIALMVLLNGFTVCFLWVLATADRRFLQSLIDSNPNAAVDLAKSAIRLVTPQVLMALIGATVVQLGTALIVITQYLFPKTVTRIKHFGSWTPTLNSCFPRRKMRGRTVVPHNV